MIKILLNIALLLCVMTAFGQEENEREFEMTMEDTTFTIKQYVFCMYKKGPERSATKEEAAQLQKEHLAHLNELTEKGILHLAGPFGDDGDWRGILILDVATVEEAEKYVKEDPMVKAGRLTYELHKWWGGKGSSLK